MAQGQIRMAWHALGRGKVTPIVGSKIVRVRPMTDKEAEQEGFDPNPHSAPMVLELDNGQVIYALADEEGNGPGTLVGRNRKGESFYVTPEQRTEAGVEVKL
jgi:hypothetical protein